MKFTLLRLNVCKLLLLLPGLFTWTARAQAQAVDPEIQWRSWELPHFTLIYDARYQELAKIYAVRLEYAADRLTPFFRSGVAKTVVVLNDNTDLTNGFATPLPYPMIQSFPVLPQQQETISEYGDWEKELAIHEYTHILAMEQRRDYVSSLSWVFGSIMTPNILLPHWWHEGLAVQTETQLSDHGRLRSSLQDAWIRATVIDDTMTQMTLGEANEVNLPTWPYGARPYLFGSLFWSQVANEKSLKVGGDLAWAHGGRFPFFINSPAEDLLGQDYVAEFYRTLAAVREKVNAQLAILRKLPFRRGDEVPVLDKEVFAPRISPDGLHLAYIGKDSSTRRRLRMLTRPNLQASFSPEQAETDNLSHSGESIQEMHAPIPQENLIWPAAPVGDGPPTGSLAHLSWFPDSTRLAFDRVDIFNRFHLVSDLWLYDLRTHKAERLTKGWRVREPAVSPDGSKIAFVGLEAGRTHLDLATIEKNSTQIDPAKRKRIYFSGWQEQVSLPLFLDATHVSFQLRSHGVDRLRVADLTSGKIKDFQLHATQVQNLSLKKNKLLFVSNSSGVPNLYQTELKNNTWQEPTALTHTPTAVLSGDWDFARNEFYFTEQSTKGLRLKRMAAPQRSPAATNPLPTVPALLADRTPAVTESLDPWEKKISATAKAEDYSAGSYLWPRYWFPLFSADSYSSYLLLTTSGQDPLGKHAYSVNGTYDLNYNRFGYSLGYENNSFNWQLGGFASDLTQELPGQVAERTQYFHFQADREMEEISPYFYISPGWTWLNRSVTGFSTNQSGPSLRFLYSDYVQAGAEISPEHGQAASLTYTDFLASGSNLSYNQFELSYTLYFSKWLPEHHVVMTRLQSFYLDQTVPSTNDVVTVSQSIYANTPYPIYLMRGYLNGGFQGRWMNQGTWEYRFPISDRISGSGTVPIFIRRWHGAIVADGVNLDGYAYNSLNKSYQVAGLSRSYWDIGAEVKMDVTLGYQFPLTLYAGVYEPLEQSINNSANIAFGFLLY